MGVYADLPVHTVNIEAAEYVHGVDVTGATATVWFKSMVNTTWVDVHYNIDSGGQQDFRMTYNGALGRYEKNMTVQNGNTINYGFTYNNGVPAYNTPWYAYKVGGTVPTVTVPSFSPAGGTYSTAQVVAISCGTSGASIRYTTDGSMPTAASPIYGSPILVSRNTTINAVGMYTGMADSPVASAAYTIDTSSSNGGTVSTPALTPSSGAPPQTVAITCATMGATIRYTTNGADPTSGSPVYTGPINVTKNMTVKARAYKDGMSSSVIASGTYSSGNVPGDGTFPMQFVNNTNGKWSNSQIYIYILSMDKQVGGDWCWLKPDGTLTPVRPEDANASNHLTKNGVNYANYAFTLAQAPTWKIPKTIYGGRIYISCGSPVYIPIGVNAWGGPDLLNPNDPNSDVYYDWYEFTYDPTHLPVAIGYGGNTTQVDQFGIPITTNIKQASTGTDWTMGTALSKTEITRRYADTVSAPFKALANQYRILAPYKSPLFRPGGQYENYMQQYIDEVWNHYASNEFSYKLLGDTFTGRVVGGANGRLEFYRNGVGPYYISKPTTFDILAGAGALATGNAEEKMLEAQLCAAFNRGVAMNTQDWGNRDKYYLNAIHNEYAAFWHRVGIDKFAYGFCYDDVHQDSSVQILRSDYPTPTSVTISIGW